MTKIIQLGNEFDVLYLRKNSPWIGGVQCLASSRTPFLRDFRQVLFLQGLEEARQECHDWLGGQELPSKVSRSYFLGQGKLAKLSWSIVIGVRFSGQSRLTQVQICDMGQATGAASILCILILRINFIMPLNSIQLKIWAKQKKQTNFFLGPETQILSVSIILLTCLFLFLLGLHEGLAKYGSQTIVCLLS